MFFQLWQNSDRLDASIGSGLKSYLGTIARNAAINEKRKTYIVNGKLVMKNLAAEATLILNMNLRQKNRENTIFA